MHFLKFLLTLNSLRLSFLFLFFLNFNIGVEKYLKLKFSSK